MYRTSDIDTRVELPTHRVDIDTEMRVYTNGRVNNYGVTLRHLTNRNENIRYSSFDYQLANNNQNYTFGWYLDGLENITIKHNLPIYSRYAISEVNFKDLSPSTLVIVKPSHPYVGSGEEIIIGRFDEVVIPEPVFDRGHLKRYIVQPLLMATRLWNGRRFDLRLYSAIYATENRFGRRIEAFKCSYGLARICVNPVDYTDPKTLLTNISIQEKIEGYDVNSNLKTVYDDSSIVQNIMKDILDRMKGRLIPDRRHHLVLLGLDVVLLEDGGYRLIEVNQNPYVDYNLINGHSCQVIYDRMVRPLFQTILPHIIVYNRLVETDTWTLVDWR